MADAVLANMAHEVDVGRAATEGKIDMVELWLAAGGSPTAITLSSRGNEISLLQAACYSSRPACAAVVEMLCEAGARPNQEGYSNAPRVKLVVLRKLTERGRATVPRYHTMHMLFARRTLPDVIFWKILEFWRTDRDPPSC